MSIVAHEVNSSDGGGGGCLCGCVKDAVCNPVNISWCFGMAGDGRGGGFCGSVCHDVKGNGGIGRLASRSTLFGITPGAQPICSLIYSSGLLIVLSCLFLGEAKSVHPFCLISSTTRDFEELGSSVSISYIRLDIPV